jgi:hypothetical protein
VARTREAMHNPWEKNDPKDAQVLLHLLKTGVTQHYHDTVANQIRLRAWAVVVEIAVEVLAVEAVDLAAVGLLDVPVTDVLADDPTVLRLDQTVIA